MFSMSKRLLQVAAVLGVLIGPGLMVAHADTVLDLTSPGTGTLNLATYRTNFNQPTGTGVIQSFVRMQASNNTFESGFNTDAKKPPLDDLAGNFTHSVRVSDLQAQVIAGVNGGNPVYT